MKDAIAFLFGTVNRTCATTMILGGIVLPLTVPGNTYLAVVGSLFAALGGAGISTSGDLDKLARERVAPRLVGATRYLVIFINQLARIKERVDSEELDAEDGLEHAAEILPGLRVLVTEFTQISGVQFDPASHNFTLEKMTQMITDLETKSNLGAENPQDLREQVNALRAAKQALETVGVSDIPRTESGICPHCLHTSQFVIGTSIGSSAMPQCAECNHKFHAHRQSDGTVKTKAPGGSSRVEKKITCGECGLLFSTRLPPLGSIAERFCVQCGNRVRIQSDGDIVNSQKMEIIASDAVSVSDGQTELHCPVHGQNARRFFRSGNSSIAVCSPFQAESHLLRYTEAT